MRRILAFLSLLALSACASLTTATVPTVKAQQAVDFAASAYKTSLRAENIYLRQAPCGLAGSPQPPLCASYAVGVKWKAVDAKLKDAIVKTQAKIDAVGTDPKVIEAAVAALQLAREELDNFIDSEVK